MTAAFERLAAALAEPAAVWPRQGNASDQPISVRALAYVIAGHVRHHLEVLEARYTG